MKTTLLMFLAGVAAVVMSCKRDLYTEKDLVFDPLLVGAWNPVQAKEGSAETWAFTKGDDNVVLAASTSVLQKFVIEHVDEQEFFGGAMKLKRKAAPGGGKD